MIICKINFDKNRCICFLIKKEKVFIKFIEILEKVNNNTSLTMNLYMVQNIYNLKKNRHK